MLKCQSSQERLKSRVLLQLAASHQVIAQTKIIREALKLGRLLNNAAYVPFHSTVKEGLQKQVFVQSMMCYKVLSKAQTRKKKRTNKTLACPRLFFLFAIHLKVGSN